MNAVENQVRGLVEVELAAANERFPQFHSQHEGWAVILEEVQECEREIDNMKFQLKRLWDHVKHNEQPYPMRVYDRAINAACEAIQVAAMCKKFLEMEGRMNE